MVVLPTWHLDGNVSWYGPGFYGKRTACGLAMTESLKGVAHKLAALRNADHVQEPRQRQDDHRAGRRPRAVRLGARSGT